MAGDKHGPLAEVFWLSVSRSAARDAYFPATASTSAIDTAPTLETADQKIGILVVEGFLVDGAGNFR